MRFLLLSKNNILAEFDFYKNQKQPCDQDSAPYIIEEIQILNAELLPWFFKTKEENKENLHEFFLDWIASRQIAQNRPKSDQVRSSYNNDLVCFARMSLCLSEDDHLWVVEKNKYVDQQNKYVFETLRNLEEVKQYEEKVFEKTFGITTKNIPSVEEILDEEALKRHQRIVGKSQDLINEMMYEKKLKLKQYRKK